MVKGNSANFVILLLIAIKAITEKENQKKLIITCGLMLWNIPIMLFYCWIVTILLNTMRIRFTNSTPTKLTDINIVGCETKHIDELKIGESETVWIKITGDCAINMNYLSNGQRKVESVAGYVTVDMGQKMKHNIGGVNSPQF